MSGPRDRKVVLTGVGLLSSLGDRPETLHGALALGESGLGELSLFAAEGPAAHPASRLVGELRDFDAKTYLPQGNLRPLDRTGRLVAAAVQLALDDAGWSRDDLAERELGLVLGTMFCSARTIAEFDRRALTAGPIYAKPMDFANSVLNAAAGQSAIWHDLRGINSTVGGGPTAGLQALATAFDLIRGGRADALLAGGAEELCFESFLGFGRAGLLCGSANGASGAGEPRPIPFDAQRDGLALGEGACLLMLEEEESARRRDANILGEVRGHASTFDPSRGENAGDALARAIRLALQEAGVEAGDLDLWSAGANGSPAGDRHEAQGTRAALGEVAAVLPATSVKGQLGETLGAGGAFQTLVALESLRRGELPGIPGLEERDEDAAVLALAADSREISGRLALVTSLGLDGGACCAVVEARKE